MKIGFDGKRATNNLTGLGNYSRSLIAQLAEFFPQNQYFVYSPKIKEHPQIRHFLNLRGIQAELPDQPGLLWRTSGIKKQLSKDNIELFHGLSHEIPLGIQNSGIRSMVTIHDLIFLRFPKYFGRIDRFIYKLKARYSCKHADKIVAISECTKRDIIEFFHTDPDKIEVIYQSCDDSFKSPSSEKVKQDTRTRNNLPPKYILNVGTIETRKNLLTLVKALPEIDPDYQLVVVGKRTAYTELVYKEIDRLGLKDRVHFLQNVPFDELPSIYQMASAFIYPSIYEGFGIPIIEALYSGVPVIAATGSCLEEAGGENSLYVAPFDHATLATAINGVLNDPTLAEQMKIKGLEYVQKFDTRVIAEDLMKVYTQVLSSHQK
ncbi:glycosyltransferase family 4 protein [Pedobacter caeni]|uniref:Glycosyltransferase involved in cell wall bisynthesis n=1 Tax=Pedobacter caeni TaxID=288992 RepID=A0A1M5ET01_9SPHI|nr:glycosyltransferase family 1 protein [Pedobacter caeni]SHF82349.1 Glycosyltransferase involved in cell wall bisynthesis [Pedobacter caeni]